MITENKIGTKVHYVPFEGCEESKIQNGVIKAHSEMLGSVFVVYNCAGDWENFKDYTGALTKTSQLRDGWI